MAFVIGGWQRLSAFKRLTIVCSVVMSTALISLMFYWYYFVIRKLLRVCGCIKGRSKKQDKVDDAAELVTSNDEEDHYKSAIVNDDGNQED